MTLQPVRAPTHADRAPSSSRRGPFPLGESVRVHAWAPFLLCALTSCEVATPSAEDSVVLTVTASVDTLPADGRARATITATLAPRFAARLDGPVVVQFSSTGGILSATTAAANADGDFVVELAAEGPESLLGAPSREATIRAFVTIDEETEHAATTGLTFVLPTDVPVLSVAVAPSVAVADGVTSIGVEVTLHNVDDPSLVTLTTSAGSLLDDALPLTRSGDVFVGETTLTAPPSPALAEVVARLTLADGGTVRATTLVDFVDADGPQFDLTGTFAELAFARVKMTSSTLTPNPQCAVAPSILRIEAVQDGDSVTLTHTPCHVTLPPVTTVAGTVTTETPPAFLAALPVVTDQSTLSSRALGAPLVPPESLVVVGAELANPRTDPLPTSPDDERVRDDDGDGAPGVTVISSLGGEQHATYRNRGQLMGRIESSTRVDGSVPGELIAVTETSVLGVGNSFLPVTTPLPGVFEMVRVDGQYGSFDVDGDDDGIITCTEIIDAASLIFTLTAPATPADCGGL